jgi:hypothetical protein
MYFKFITRNGVAFKTILEVLSITKTTNKLLLMDTCHAGNTLDIEEKDKTTFSEEGQRDIIIKLNSKDPKFKVRDIFNSLFDDILSKSGLTILSASSGSNVAYEINTINGWFYIRSIKRSYVFNYRKTSSRY